MNDVAIVLDHRCGALAEMGEALGGAGISIEGGGVFAAGGQAIGHFLFDGGEAAAAVLRGAGIRVAAVRPVIALRLKQAVPGQLGRVARLMASAGVSIEVQYSDHQNRLILVVDEPGRGREVADAWTAAETTADGH
jgi:hypothetical protein